MAEDAHLRARLTLDSNVDEAVRLASQSLSKSATDVEKAQQKIAKTIVKGDPLKAIEAQARKEIAVIERLVERDQSLRAQGEQAKEAILQKATSRRLQILEREEQRAARSAVNIRDRFGKIEQPLNDLRGVVDTLGIASSSAAGQMAMLVTDSVAAFSSGGLLALGVAGVTGAVYQLVTAYREAGAAAREAALASRKEWTDANEAIAAQVASVRESTTRRRLRLSGVSDAELQGADLVGAAQMQVGDQRAAVNAVQAQIDRLRQQRETSDALAQALSGEDRASAVRAREALDRQIAERMQQLAAATDQLREAEENLEGARLAASELRTLELDELAAKGAQAAAAGPAARARTGAGSARGGGLDPMAMLRAADQREAAELAAQRAGAAAFARDEAAKDDAFSRIVAEARGKAAQDMVDAKASEQMEMAGAAWAVSFAQGFASALKEGDAMGILSTVLTSAGAAIATLFPTVGGIVGGGALGLLGGMFERGGTSYGYHLPQGRNGLAVLPSVNFDAMPAWLHKNEVTIPEKVVNRDLGGLPQAAALAAGRGLPGGGDGARVEVHNHIRAMDAVDAMDGFRRSMGQAIHLLSETRQSALAFAAMDRPAPRYA